MERCVAEYARLQDEKIRVKLVQCVVQNFLRQTSGVLVEQYRETFQKTKFLDNIEIQRLDDLTQPYLMFLQKVVAQTPNAISTHAEIFMACCTYLPTKLCFVHALSVRMNKPDNNDLFEIVRAFILEIGQRYQVLRQEIKLPEYLLVDCGVQIVSFLNAQREKVSQGGSGMLEALDSDAKISEVRRQMREFFYEISKEN